MPNFTARSVPERTSMWPPRKGLQDTAIGRSRDNASHRQAPTALTEDAK
jgi:hypothetical protein